MMDGSVLGGKLVQYQINHEPPYWIQPPHQEFGAYNIYLQTSIGEHYTSSLRERRLPYNLAKPHVPFHIYLHTQSGKHITAENIRFIDNNHRNDLSKDLVYLAMPDGSVFVGDFP